MINIVVICIIIFILYFYAFHPLLLMEDNSEVLKRAKTGDIVMFHSLDNFNSVFEASYFNHVAIVIVENGKKLILEAFMPSSLHNWTKPIYGNPEKGVVISDLENRLNSYRGYVFYKELIKPLSEEVQREFLDYAKWSVNYFEYEKRVVTNQLRKLLFNESLNRFTNCGEFVYLALVKLGLLNKRMLNENRKYHLKFVNSITHLNNNGYKKPVYSMQRYFR